MGKLIIQQKYSCYIFGEGKKDRDFLKVLIDLDKFKYHTPNWIFNYGNASGGSAQTVLEKCQKEMINSAYHLILCFIDLDDLKNDFPTTWEKEKNKLEINFSHFTIIWQLDNAEQEYKKVLGELGNGKNKHTTNKLAKDQIKKFINSNFWKRILKPIKEKAQELNDIKNRIP